MSQNDLRMPVGKIIISHDMVANGDMVMNSEIIGDIPIATAIGLLRMAEDNLLHPQEEIEDGIDDE